MSGLLLSGQSLAGWPHGHPVDSRCQLADLVARPLRRPIHTSLADRLRLLVIDGRLVDGVRLPSERELAARLELSRSTVAAAYAALREPGVWNAAGIGQLHPDQPRGLASRHSRARSGRSTVRSR